MPKRHHLIHALRAVSSGGLSLAQNLQTVAEKHGIGDSATRMMFEIDPISGEDLLLTLFADRANRTPDLKKEVLTDLGE